MIPNTDNSLNLGDFRPISLIRVFYKILAKLLAERLKPIMSNIISETQSAFIKGHSILEVVLITNEVIDFLRRKKRKGLIFKVNFDH